MIINLLNNFIFTTKKTKKSEEKSSDHDYSQPVFLFFRSPNSCFVDVGIKESGLVHISQLKDGFVSDVNEVVKLHQHVQVKVLEIDEARKRIQLTMIL